MGSPRGLPIIDVTKYPDPDDTCLLVNRDEHFSIECVDNGEHFLPEYVNRNKHFLATKIEINIETNK